VPPSPTQRFEPQNRIAGKFRLRRRIAAGGMGEVWVARNESTGADVALKVLRRGDADKEQEMEVEERFRQEARLSAMLSHRSIVRVFDLVDEPGGVLVLVMELLRGETLQAYLERMGPRPPREGVAIITPILGALGHAHERGIVHRDVTPANVFLAVDPDGHVTPKLVDFGIAKLAPGASPRGAAKAVQTVDGRVLGTPRYMAPERIRGDPELDGRVDVFAAAVVLYEAMTGVSPFAASTPSASLAAVLERHIDPDPRIDPRLWVEIQRALAKRSYERHATAHELATALRAAVGETEGSLDASLRRSIPTPAWDDADATEPPEIPAEQRSIQSAVVVVPRKGVSSAAWFVGAALLGAVAAGLVWMRAGPRLGASAPAAVAPGETASAAPATPPTPETATPAATGTSTAAGATATGTAPATASPAEPAASPPGAGSSPTSTGAAAATAPAWLTKTPATSAPAWTPPGARPVATSPGFGPASTAPRPAPGGTHPRGVATTPGF
jgi:serine/threonine protein kinase